LLVAGKKEYYTLIPNDSLRHIGRAKPDPLILLKDTYSNQKIDQANQQTVSWTKS